MSKVEIITTLNRHSLMNKSKSDLAEMVLQYADIQEPYAAAKVSEALDQVGRRCEKKSDYDGKVHIIDMWEEIAAFIAELRKE